MIGRNISNLQMIKLLQIKLLEIAEETKEALSIINANLPADVSAAEMTAKIDDLETAISELDAVDAERERLVNVKGEKAGALSDYLAYVRLAVKKVCGPDSLEYEMIDGTQSSEWKKPKRMEEDGGENTWRHVS